MDMFREPKFAAFAYASQSDISEGPVLKPVTFWARGERNIGGVLPLIILTNCDEVELFLNGRSLGRQTMPRYSELKWKVPYQPGTLSAKGYDGGKPVAETQVETTGAPATVQLAADRPTIHADGADVAVISIAVQDAEGRVVPVADNHVSFSVEGPARIIGVGNGDPNSHEPDKATARSLYNGYAQVIVQSEKGGAGMLMLRATSPGLTAATAALQVRSVPTVPSVN
jgi:beta-galactosidase